MNHHEQIQKSGLGTILTETYSIVDSEISEPYTCKELFSKSGSIAKTDIRVRI